MTTTKLTDLQRVLLSTAARREDGQVLPLETPSYNGPQARKAVAALIRRDLVREVETADNNMCWREEGDRRFGAMITAAGYAAIGVSEPNENDRQAAPPPRASSKIAQVLDLLKRPDGATLGELTAATGWLPHTTRAALTGLRKKGHAISRGKRGELSCYQLATGA